jgi:mRNA interferase RelE/StbE
MPYSIELSPPAQRQLKKLSPDLRGRIIPILRSLQANPRPHGKTAKLTGEENTYRIRAGDYRILYEVHDSTTQIIILAILNRREAYR